MSMQSGRATFTGVELYVDVLLAAPYASYSVIASGLVCDDTTAIVGGYELTIQSSGVPSVVRVEPTDLFIGRVDFLVAEI